MTARATYKPATYDLYGLSERELQTIRYGLSLVTQENSKESEPARLRRIDSLNLLTVTREALQERKDYEAEQGE